MYTVVNDLREGIEVDVVKYRDAISKYNCLLSDACLKLYDLCYLGSPSELDDKEVIRGIIQEFPEFCKYLMEYSTGIYSWSEQMMLYAKFKTRGLPRGEEFAEVITAFSSALRAKEALKLLDNIGVKIGVNSKRIKVIKPRFTLSEWLKDVSVFDCNLPVVMEIAKREDNTRIVTVDTSEYLRTYLITEYMGVPEEKLKQSTSSKGFFIKGISRVEELQIFYLIVTNAIECDTKFGKAYEKKRMREVSEVFESKKMHKQEAFESVVFQATRDKRSAKIAKEREKFKEFGCRSFFIDAYRVYFEVKNGTSLSSEAFERPRPDNGKYAIDYSTGKQFQLFNLLDGITGEFISDKEVKRNGYFPIVSPVLIKRVTLGNGDKPIVNAEWYYPIYGVLYNDAVNDKGEYISKSLTPLVGTKVRLRHVPEESVLKYFNAKDSVELFDAVSLRVKPRCRVPRQYAGGYKDYITDLVCAFIYLNFCQMDYEFRNTFYDFLSDEMKLKAFVEAQWQFENLKI